MAADVLNIKIEDIKPSVPESTNEIDPKVEYERRKMLRAAKGI